MINFVVGSAFRNAGSGTEGAGGLTQAARAVERVHALKRILPSTGIRMIAAEGDSTDDTRAQLTGAAERYGVDLTILDASHGGPVFGSTEAPDRMRLLSGVGNTILSGVDLERDDVLLYVESDLIWTPSVVIDLCAIVLPAIGSENVRETEGWRIGVPLIMAGEHFYDVWGFRGMDGQRWAPFPPYHSERKLTGLTEVSSAGSCLLMPAGAAVEAPRMTDGALVEWCAGARACGYHIMVHPTAIVRHPA